MFLFMFFPFWTFSDRKLDNKVTENVDVEFDFLAVEKLRWHDNVLGGLGYG